MANMCNPCYFDGEYRIAVWGHPRQKDSEILSQQTNLVWWCTPLIPVTWEMEVEVLKLKTNLDKAWDPIWKTS
jgi:hypothetical protein